jgi:nucleoside-diphosphate-sugar epimerase
MRGEQPTLQFEGLATRDFIYVSDLVEGLILAGSVDGVDGQVFNLCTGIETTVRELVELIIEAAKSSVKPILVPSEHYYTSRMVGSYEKAARSLGFEPKVALREGIAKTVAWCQANEREFSQPQPYSYLSG